MNRKDRSKPSRAQRKPTRRTWIRDTSRRMRLYLAQHVPLEDFVF